MTGAGSSRPQIPLLESVADVHRDAVLPKYAAKTLVDQAAANPPAVDATAPAAGRKAVIYATCFANYNSPDIGMDALGVLARNGVEAKVVYPFLNVVKIDTRWIREHRSHIFKLKFR